MDVLGFNVSEWLLLVILILTGCYFLLTWNLNKLSELGIPHDKPWPILGNMGFLFKVGVRDLDLAMYKKHGKIYGFYEGHNPTIVVFDVDVLRQILVKDFHLFADRRPMYFRGILKHGVFDVTGSHWKGMRSILTPAFSTGKLKPLTRLMNQCADTLVGHIDATVDEEGIFETKTFAQSFTMDVIASTAFGMRLDSKADPNDPFNVMAKKLFDITTFDVSILLWIMFTWSCPLLDKLDYLRMFSKEAETFFITVLTKAIEERQENKDQTYKDFLNIMLNAELVDQEDVTKESLGDAKKGLTAEEVMGNALLFFAAGFETTATTISFLIYYLATVPEVQEKLAEEIHNVVGNKHEGNYEDIVKMTYMDKVINETLRLCTPITRVDRQCTEDVEYKGMRIPKGMIVSIPILALHYDPEAWPEPHKFDPERFSPEEKAKRDPLYFMPFGAGPRTCIGNRLALMEIKLTLIKLIKTFKFVTCEKTQIPLNFDQNRVLSQTVGGIYVKAERR